MTKSLTKRHCIYISLFGLKSIEDIATKIVLDFYQSKYFERYFNKAPLTKKRLKITQSVLKIGLRGFLNFKRLGNVNDYLTDIKTIGENVLDTNELVICFDDLERKDSSLKIEDLTGYINSLVDEGIKVLIISNEDLLLKNGGDVYKNLKEKIIGITVEFIPNVKETLLNIIKLRYSTFPVYLKYLTENIEDLFILSKATNNNFRHIIYALDSLHHCYSIIKNEIIDNVNHELNEKVKEEIRNISNLTLALAIEYKSSTIKFNNLNDYKESYLFFDQMLGYNQRNSDNLEEKEKSKVEIFLIKYNIAKEQYHLYDTIYNYVTAYDEFSLELFISEFKNKFNLVKGKVLPQYELLNSLSYQNCFNLSDNDYKEKTLAIIEYAKNGQFATVDYLSIMHYAERLNNILELNLEEVKNSLVIGLKKSIHNPPTSISSFTQFEMSGRMSEISVISRQLYQEGMKEIKSYQEKQLKNKIEAIANLITSNPIEFERQYHIDSNFQFNLSHYPFLNYVNPDELFEKIKIANSQTLHFLRNFFKDRYESIDKLKDELQNFKKLTTLFVAYRDALTIEPGNKIRNFIISEFTDSLLVIRDKGVQLYELQQEGQK